MKVLFISLEMFDLAAIIAKDLLPSWFRAGSVQIGQLC